MMTPGGLLPLREVQKAIREITMHFYPRGDAETVYAADI